MAKKIIVVLALLSAGCGKECADMVGTLCIEKEATRIVGYHRNRVLPLVESALAHCGGNWEQLRGWSVTASPGHIDCGGADAMRVTGCSDFGSDTITIRTDSCLEQSSLVFEICNIVTHQGGSCDSAPADLCQTLWEDSYGKEGCSYWKQCQWAYNKACG